MPTIRLSFCYYSLVDEEDAERFGMLRWSARAFSTKGRSYVYAVCYSRHFGTVHLHRAITGAPEGLLVDHINGDTIDNRRSNLRICTPQDNSRNRRGQFNNTSGFKGVSKFTQTNKWHAQIGIGHSRKLHLGAFDTPEAAARAYDAAAIKYHGEFARLNFPIKDHAVILTDSKIFA